MCLSILEKISGTFKLVQRSKKWSSVQVRSVSKSLFPLCPESRSFRHWPSQAALIHGHVLLHRLGDWERFHVAVEKNWS